MKTILCVVVILSTLAGVGSRWILGSDSLTPSREKVAPSAPPDGVSANGVVEGQPTPRSLCDPRPPGS